jgi:tRNA A-37 threonylcarbamoyl transferase component Bud32
VIKIQEPGDSQRERLRTLAGRKVGEQTGLFAVPAILSFDDSRGEIVFERLQLTGLRQALSEADGSLDLVERTARALAAIHGQMEAGTTAGAGSAGRGMNRNEVPLHGDFGMRNVFLLPASNQIAIIDWANADWTQVDADLGVPEIDIAVFLVSLFHRRIFGPWPLTHRREMARHFLATYAADSPFGLDLQILSSIVAVFRPAFTRLVRRRKGGLRALGSRHAMMDLDFFLRGLSREKYQRLEPQRTG